jgi:hypothetical protein
MFIVENVNQSVHQVFDYTPDELLCQSFISILHSDQKEDINNKLSLLRIKQANDQFESHITCFSLDNQEIPYTISIIGLKKDPMKTSIIM